MPKTCSLHTVPAGTTIQHPAYDVPVTVAAPLDRGELTNAAGFTRGVWINHPTRGRIAVYAYTTVEV